MNLKYMNEAVKQAKEAYLENEIPVGAIIVKNNEIIAGKHNLKEKRQCSIYHAEILAIIDACAKLGTWHLDDCDLYVTLEPCPMCASAIKQARIKNVYSGLSASDKNNSLLVEKIFRKDNANPGVNFYNDLYTDEIRKLMQNFFVEKRKR